jgi:prepilin-type N-terminal cleavage/methylation domain-containing protein
VADLPVMKRSIKPKKSFLSNNSSTFFASQTNGVYLPVCGQNGFSLTEMLIVIALISILSYIAVPQINTMINKYRLTGATRIVWGDLQNARMTALKMNQSIQVAFSSTTYSFVKVSTNTTIFTRSLGTDYPNITVALQSGSSITFSSTGQTTAATVNVVGTSGTKTLSISGIGRIIIN